MKRTIMKISIIAMFVSVICTNFAMAIDFGVADEFIEKGADTSMISNLDTIGSEFASIGNVLKFIGAGIIIAATAYMGILYMISPPERQAKLKQQLIGVVVSAIVIFGAYGIWKTVGMLVQNFEN